jgi:L-alanine-DL-glutamate epimerase-like enolase superfamily enzyme
MRISNVELICLRHYYSPEERYEWSGAEALGVQALVVRVTTDGGLYGLGEIGVDIPAAIAQPLVEYFSELLIGEAAEDIERIWEIMYRAAFSWGRRGIPVSVMGAIDIALWDLKGKALGVPVYQLLGGKAHDKILAYASGGEEQPLEQLAEELRGYVQQGYRVIKIRMGYPEFERNHAIVETAREAVGPNVELAVDSGQCYVPRPWNIREATRLGHMLEDYDIAWFEEPWVTDDLAGWAKLAAALDVPISGGEASWTRWDFEVVMTLKAMDIIQPDVSISGGISECRRIAANAQTRSVQIINHTWTSGIGFPANLHLVAATPNIPMVEFPQVSNPIAKDLMKEQPVFKDGYIKYPIAPGLGVELTDEVIEKYSKDKGPLYVRKKG